MTMWQAVIDMQSLTGNPATAIREESVMTRLFIALSLLLAILSGCTSAGYRAVNPAEYASVHADYDVTFGWNLKPQPDGIMIEGYARNNRYLLINDMTLEISLLAADGTKKASESLFIHPPQLERDAATVFSTVLHAAPGQGETLRFTYRYLAIEDNEEALFWMSSFNIPAVKP